MTRSPGKHPTPTQVAICVCTFRRPAGLERLLQGLSGQRFTRIGHPEIVLIVIDNEGSPEVEVFCETFTSGTFKALRYIHEPRRGISYARNSGLDSVPQHSEFIAMIDDDEVPEPDWLEQLLVAQQDSGADVVIGPTIPVFPDKTPDWIQKSGLFKKPRNQDEYADLQPDPPAATCNVLLRAQILRDSGIRFDPRLALSGGEDKLFFRAIKLAGYSFVWAKNARVLEAIPLERARFGHIWREEFRRGNVTTYVKKITRTMTRKERQSKLLRKTKDLRRSLRHIVFGTTGVLTALLPWNLKKECIATEAIQIARGMGILSSVLGIRSEHYK